MRSRVMFLSNYKDVYLFRTRFSEKYDLVQKFRGPFHNLAAYNNPVNFLEAGFMDLRSNDPWHSDLPLSIMTDEPTPAYINDAYLGANHSFPSAVSVYVKNHGKDFGDIGSLWCDGDGTVWTLISVERDTLSFISENLGKSREEYSFKVNITPPLKYLENGKNPENIYSFEDSWRAAMSPFIKHTECEVYACFENGIRRVANRSIECDFAEIHEKYEIVNPVSMAEAIHGNRPKEGYSAPITNAMGDAMVKVSLIYRIECDGTVTVDFRYDRAQDIKFTRCMGAMFQPKLDAYGGGVQRYIPKSVPFSTAEGSFDFTSRVDLSYGMPFPKKHPLTKEYWESPDNPPDRILDYFKDKEDRDKLAFACGYLPIYDGVPSVRKNYLGAAVGIVGTKKAYPFFMDDTELTHVHGIAYKKYFTPDPDGKSFYTLSYGGKKYYYFDFFKPSAMSLEAKGDIELIEKSEGVSYSLSDGRITVSAERGYAVFASEE